MNAINNIINYAINFDAGKLSKEDIAAITDYFVDYVGVTIAGSRELASYRAQRLAGQLSKQGIVNVLGTDIKLSAEWASFCNGISCHILDWDDMYWDGLCHIGSFVFNTALSVSQSLSLSGKEFLVACFLGYEFAMRISNLQVGKNNGPKVPRKGFDISSTVGVLTSAFVAAKLMNFSHEQFVHTIGLAVNQASGIYQAIREKETTHSFSFHHGWGSLSGIIAANLAKTGFQSDTDAIFGEIGYLHCFAVYDDARLDKVEPFSSKLNPLNSIKCYPACAYVCNALTALFACVKNNVIDFNKIKNIKLFVTESAYNMCYLPKEEKLKPASSESARLSIPFCVASAIVDKKFTIQQTNEKSLRNNEKLKLADSILVMKDGEMEKLYPNLSPVKIIIEDEMGCTYDYLSVYEKGNYLNPMEREEREDKFLSCVESVIKNPRQLLSSLKNIFYLENFDELQFN